MPRSHVRTCLSLALGAMLAFVAGCHEALELRPPNIVLITLDTTRADHLGVYGHVRPTSPNLDAFASNATLYSDALSTSSWTLPAHASLFTGRFPSGHGARYDANGPLVLAEVIGAPRGIRARGLSVQDPTLAQQLTDAGYETAAVVAGPWLLRGFGLAEGFGHYDDRRILDYAGRSAEDVAAAALAWLDGDRERPFFLFLNFFDPHFPYEPPPPHDRAFLAVGETIARNRRDQWPALYDAEIRYMDEQVGRVLDRLRERGHYTDTLIAVTSDHGELFGEHGGWGHGKRLYQELVHVPLIVKWPGAVTGRVEDARVQIHELYGVLLGAAGVMPPPAFPEPGALRLAEVEPISPSDTEGSWKALWDGRLKYLHNGLGRHRLHDLDDDPREQLNLLDARSEETERLQARLADALAHMPKPSPSGPAAEVDARTREALDRLGYLDAE